MLRERMEKVNDMKKKMNNVSIEIKTLGKNQKELLGNNMTESGMKNVSDGLI